MREANIETGKHDVDENMDDQLCLTGYRETAPGAVVASAAHIIPDPDARSMHGSGKLLTLNNKRK
jgi:hypothetical protein